MRYGVQKAAEVHVRLSQHIGAPAECVVKAGDVVSQGDVIGRAKEGALSVNVHASVCGTVMKTSDTEVVIRAAEPSSVTPA